ncbi:MAG: M50 family metallopeptidase [Actinomycetota bacterium]
MSSTVGVFAFIFTLVVVIVVHEFGHYVAAKKSGMKVEEFFFGFGPRLFSWFKGETEYGIKAFPLGGYVKIAGMNPFQPVSAEDVPRTFGARPSWQRAIVLLAGSTTHFILAFLILLVLLGIVGIPTKVLPVVDSVKVEVNGEASPAQQAGLRPGDEIVAINDERVLDWDGLKSKIRSHPNEEILLSIVRGDQRLRIPVTTVVAEAQLEADPSKSEKVAQIGFIPRVANERLGPGKAVVESAKTTGELIWGSIGGVRSIFSFDVFKKVFNGLMNRGTRSAEDSPIGIYGAGRAAGQVAAAGGYSDLISFLVFFIVFLGVINLVPLPPLDGGHLLVLAIEKVIGRKIDLKKLVPVATLVLGFFMFLFVALLYLDIARPIANPFQ